MKVISLNWNEKYNAGPKAPRDIDVILKEAYNSKTVSYVRSKSFFKQIQMVLTMYVASKSKCVVIQYPLFFNKKFFRIFNPNRTIVLIHDLKGLRNNDEKTDDLEIDILKDFKYIIVHNQKMKEYLVSRGLQPSCLFVLEIFDYLTDGKVVHRDHRVQNVQDLRVVYAGNLVKAKSPFLHQLDAEQMDFKIHAYGLGVDEDINANTIYKGVFESESVSVLDGDIGLVWDGNYDESDEAVSYKNYTKYNNPHKISCYLAAGLPVIVWEKSAIADFVRKEKIGYTISNIYDINHLDVSEYETYKKNAIKIGQLLTQGAYTKRALSNALDAMENRE